MKIHNPKEQEVYNILSDTANDMGFDIVRVRIHGGNRPTLEIIVDSLDINKKVSISDCRNLSNNFSAILDVEDIIQDKYFLEVSSAGVERPLVKLEDFTKFLGKYVSIKLHNSIEDKKRFDGEIIKVENNQIYLSEKLDDKKYSENILQIEYENIKSAKLIFTEEMFRMALRAK